MNKIPTLFVRDEKTRLVLPEVASGCQWVLEGQGIATQKWEGSCCLVQGEKLYKRLELKPGRPTPVGFIPCETDPLTSKIFGWLPVGEGPEDQWHREAWLKMRAPPWSWTYELCGPNVQANPESEEDHVLIPHGHFVFKDLPRTFEGIRSFLEKTNIEGLVFWKERGILSCPKAKIKKRDFGFKR